MRARADRVRALDPSPPVAAAFDRLDAAFDAVDRPWAAASKALADAEQGAWSRPLPPAPRPDALVRLPARLGAGTLRRRLDVEEAIGTPVRTLFAEVTDTLGRLGSMAATKPRAASGARATTIAGCTAAWAPIATWARGQPAMHAAGLECAVAVRRLGSARRAPAELTLELLRLGVVEPTEDDRRAKELPALALLTGRLAPGGHRRSLSMAALAGLHDETALGVALAEAVDTLCLTATALWIHGELGPDDALETALAARCDGRAPRAWIAAAEARPRAALEGLALRQLGTGPAHVVALERFWWVPLGLVDALADPATIRPPEAPIEVHTEPLEPEPAAP